MKDLLLSCREPTVISLGGQRRWARPVFAPSDELQEVLDALAVPELAFSLLAAGLLGVMIWLATPGMIGSGVVGAVLLLAGGIGMAAAAVSAAALTLLVLAAAALWFEVRYVPGLGLYAIGGWFALTLGGLLLFGAWSGAHPAVVFPLATLTALGTYLAGRRSWQRIDDDPFADSPLLTGRHAIVLHTDGVQGQALVGGQLWTIRSRRGLLRPGQRVWIADAHRDWLIVEPDPWDPQ
jgi:membrane-bound serine protease (ClpP class)